MLSRLLKKTVQAGPAFAKKSLLEGELQAFYQRLRRALPNSIIVPDMALSALMTPLATDARALRQQLAQLDGRKVAFAVFDGALDLQCVIELTRAGGDESERALTLELLQGAGIKHFSWEADRLPTHEQILRAMVAFTGIEAPKFEPAANSILRTEPAAPVARLPVPQRRISTSSLTVEELYALTPQGHVKTTYPHIWERICLFCNDPAHLADYIATLSMQNRSVKRAGFPSAVMVEINEIEAVNAQFINKAPEKVSWNDVFADR